MIPWLFYQYRWHLFRGSFDWSQDDLVAAEGDDAVVEGAGFVLHVVGFRISFRGLLRFFDNA